MKKTLAIFFLLSAFTVITFAQQPSTENDIPAYCATIDRSEKPLVPCGTQFHICYDTANAQCEFKHLFVLVNNMTKNFITVVFAPLIVIVLMYIGFLFIKDQAGAKVKAKALILRVLIGTFFVLGAWLIVNFILSALNVDTEIKKTLQDNNTN